MKQRMRWAGHTACMAALRNSWKILGRIPERRRPHEAVD
jgi:hypothetical protein